MKKRLLARSQNLWEETFLRLCVDRLKNAKVKAIWLCDRGFHRVLWLLKRLVLNKGRLPGLRNSQFARQWQGAADWRAGKRVKGNLVIGNESESLGC